MYSYGYKVPEVQSRVARQRQPVEPDNVIPNPSVEDVIATENTLPSAPPNSLSPREFFESQILPQVRSVIGDSGVDDAYLRTIREDTRQSFLRDIEESDRRNLEQLRGTPVSIPIQLPQPISLTGLGSAHTQPGIPGLFAQVEASNEGVEALRKQRVADAFGDLLSKYPELNRVLYAAPATQNKALRVKKSGFEPYLDYVDKTQVFSSPESRAGIYNEIIGEYASLEDNPDRRALLAEALRETEQDYTSGAPERQSRARKFLQNMLDDPATLERVETPSFRENRPVIGGGGYEPVKNNPLVKRINQRAKAFNNLYSQLDLQDRLNITDVYPGLRFSGIKQGDQAGFYLDPDTKEVSGVDFNDPEAYGVNVTMSAPGSISLEEFDNYNVGSEVSKNALRFLADYPVTTQTSVSFTTREPGYSESSYGAKLLPSELVGPVTSFVSDTAFRGLRPGTLVVNSPLSSNDLYDKRIETGKSGNESNTLRRLQPFIDSNSPLPNLRGIAYTSAGFGPVSEDKTQLSYVDDKGQAIPIQLGRAEVPLKGRVAVRDAGGASVFTPALPASSTPRYYGLDPVSGAALGGAEVLRNLRRVPSALLPGAADLIPSPEAVRTGYQQGPVAMGKQMAQEFVQSLPTAAAAAGVLSAPLAAPLAPGIGAGLVGTAGARALNEVVRQETGEGIVPKLRQAIGTAPRTGAASPSRAGSRPLTAQVRPLTTAQRAEVTRQQNRNELQRRIELAQQRFNPGKLEFGLSELLRGR
jgi:hypothetical protein